MNRMGLRYCLLISFCGWKNWAKKKKASQTHNENNAYNFLIEESLSLSLLSDYIYIMCFLSLLIKFVCLCLFHTKDVDLKGGNNNKKMASVV